MEFVNKKNIPPHWPTRCPWTHGLRPKKLPVSVVVPPAPVRLPSQRLLAPSVASVTSVANDKRDNEMILGVVQRSPALPFTIAIFSIR